jgi:hypothetical protein
VSEATVIEAIGFVFVALVITTVIIIAAQRKVGPLRGELKRTPFEGPTSSTEGGAQQ